MLSGKRLALAVSAFSMAFCAPAFSQTWYDPSTGATTTTLAPVGSDGSSSYTYCVFGQGCFQSQPACQIAPDGSCVSYIAVPEVYPAYPQPYYGKNYPRRGVGDQSNYWQGDPNNLGPRVDQNRGQSFNYRNTGPSGVNVQTPNNGLNAPNVSRGNQPQIGGGAGAGSVPRGNGGNSWRSNGGGAGAGQ